MAFGMKLVINHYLFMSLNSFSFWLDIIILVKPRFFSSHWFLSKTTTNNYLFEKWYHSNKDCNSLYIYLYLYIYIYICAGKLEALLDISRYVISLQSFAVQMVCFSRVVVITPQTTLAGLRQGNKEHIRRDNMVVSVQSIRQCDYLHVSLTSWLFQFKIHLRGMCSLPISMWENRFDYAKIQLSYLVMFESPNICFRFVFAHHFAQLINKYVWYPVMHCGCVSFVIAYQFSLNCFTFFGLGLFFSFFFFCAQSSLEDTVCFNRNQCWCLSCGIVQLANIELYGLCTDSCWTCSVSTHAAIGTRDFILILPECQEVLLCT